MRDKSGSLTRNVFTLPCVTPDFQDYRHLKPQEVALELVVVNRLEETGAFGVSIQAG